VALFHHRLLQKYLKQIPCLPEAHKSIATQWADNLARDIYDSETQNDSEFIQQILINLLGYIGSSAGKQWTVAKNQPIARGNVDVALGQFSADNSQILAVLELKGTKTKDLNQIMPGRGKSPVRQAFEYATDNKGTQWILVCNYRELRLYAHGYGSADYECFDLSRLTEPLEYARFILLLSADNLLGGKTKALLEESEQIEKDITDELYQDYKTLRAELIQSIAADNPDKSKLQVIRYTQTILDRILFIAFAEDKGLLADKTLEKAFTSSNPFNPQPVWENFKGLFKAIDKGNEALKIPAYNGGLFAENQNIDNLQISDALCEGFKKIGEYDFDSDISVNILGHIFEQSITDLEELKSEVSNNSYYERKKGRRKKEGIFYTPPYITRYIVEQAVGGWLGEQRKNLGFEQLPVLTDKDYASIKITGKRKIRYEHNENIAQHIRFWQNYKQIVSHIKVLDPACGSGAFLNEVFDFLKNEGEQINQQLTSLTGQHELFRWDTHILANNLYGVDLNRESVEITKLSLWLKTANRQEKLTYLQDNIKVGNSLIDDPAVAGELAFNWEKEFTAIMASGGFDVVVGNPPWVSLSGKHGQDIPENMLNWLTERYDGNTYMPNLFEYFITLSMQLLKPYGLFCMIIPDRFGYNLAFTKLRKKLLEKYRILEIVYKWSFPEVIADTVTVLVQNYKQENYEFFVRGKPDGDTLSLSSSELLSYSGIQIRAYKDILSKTLIQKIHNNSIILKDVSSITSGFGGKSSAITKKRINEKQIAAIRGSSVCRYYLGETVFFEFIDENITGRTRDTEKLGVHQKILLRKTGNQIISCYDDSGLYPEQSSYFIYDIKLDYFFILSILNSKLCTFFYRSHLITNADSTPQIKTFDLEKIPVPKARKEEIEKLSNNSERITCLIKELNTIRDTFYSLIAADFCLDKLPQKMQNIFKSSSVNFIPVLEAIVKPKKITLTQKSEWLQHFKSEQSKALELQAEINRLDKEIDQMVYRLYQLNEEEIALIEQGLP